MVVLSREPQHPLGVNFVYFIVNGRVPTRLESAMKVINNAELWLVKMRSNGNCPRRNFVSILTFSFEDGYHIIYDDTTIQSTDQ